MNKRKLFLSLALFLMAGSTLSAQNKSAGINLSIWKGVSTQPADSAQTTYFNLGILSAMNRLNGAGFNAFGSVISHNMNGRHRDLPIWWVEACVACNSLQSATLTATT